MANKTFTNEELAAVRAQVYGADTRPLTTVNLDDVAHEHEEQTFYGIESGEIIYFQPSYTKIDKQPIFEDENRKNARGERPSQYLIPVVREKNGVKFDDMFSMNTLNKRDANNKYVHGELAQGGLKARVERLCAMGAIIGGNETPIMVAAFETNGGRAKETIQDPTTKQLIVKNKVKEGKYVPISKYAPQA